MTSKRNEDRLERRKALKEQQLRELAAVKKYDAALEKELLAHGVPALAVAEVVSVSGQKPPSIFSGSPRGR